MPSREDRGKVKPELKDYIAILIALLETVLLPFVLIIITLCIIFLLFVFLY